MMLMSGDVAQRCHEDPIHPIRPCADDDDAPQRRVVMDLPRYDGAAEV